jgi:hypothetical protein
MFKFCPVGQRLSQPKAQRLPFIIYGIEQDANFKPSPVDASPLDAKLPLALTSKDRAA